MKKNEKTNKSNLSNFFLLLFALFFIFTVVFLLTMKPNNGALVSDDENSPWKGNPNAKIIVREYSDYTCPACAVAKLFIDQQLFPQYKDQVKFIFKDFPIHGIEAPSYTAALAARCAQKQNKFEETSSLIFAKQSEWGNILDKEILYAKFLDYSQNLGLDIVKFGACIRQKETKSLVEQDKKEGVRKNINSTPTFFVNDIRVVGIRDLEATIKAELAKL